MGILGIILLVVFIICSLLLLGLVLLQADSNGGGLGGVFGGGSNSAFGSRTGNVLSKATFVLLGVFMATTLGLGFVYSSNQASDDILQKGLANTESDWASQEPEEPLLDTESVVPEEPSTSTEAGE